MFFNSASKSSNPALRRKKQSIRGVPAIVDNCEIYSEGDKKTIDLQTYFLWSFSRYIIKESRRRIVEELQVTIFCD